MLAPRSRHDTRWGVLILWGAILLFSLMGGQPVVASITGEPHPVSGGLFQGCSVPADLDGDAIVTIMDIQLLASHWGALEGQPEYVPAYDFDDDQAIDSDDLQLAAEEWTHVCQEGSPTAVMSQTPTSTATPSSTSGPSSTPTQTPTITLTPSPSPTAGPLCGTLTQDTTLPAGDYVVTCALVVDTDVTLTIHGGATLRFTQNGSLTISGTLTAVGSEAQPIVMTANTATPSPGYWRGLYFKEGSLGTLDHVLLEAAGSYDLVPPTFNSGIEVEGGSVSIRNSTVRRNTGVGIYSAVGLTLTNNTIISNTGYPLYFLAEGLGHVVAEGNTLAGNTPNAVNVEGGSVTSIGTWPASLAPYGFHIITTITVEAGGGITLPPGSRLAFYGAASFGVRGNLVAQGSAAAPIVFTINAANPSPGSWAGLYFHDGSHALLDFVVVEYAGKNDFAHPANTAVEVLGGSVSLSNMTLQHNTGLGLYAEEGLTLTNSSIISTTGTGGGYPLYFFPAALGHSTLSDLTLTANTQNAIQLGAGMITETLSWPAILATHALHLIGAVSIESGASLTIPAGANLRFSGVGHIGVHGTLIAQGTETSPILFTANSDNPTVGFWTGLYLYSGSNTILEHATVEYAGKYDFTGPAYWTGIEVLGGDLSMTYSSVNNNMGRGIYIENSLPTIHHTSIYSNTEYGMYNHTPTNTVVAEQNWWGDASGPGPAGGGDDISSGIDADPWLTSPP